MNTTEKPTIASSEAMTEIWEDTETGETVRDLNQGRLPSDGVAVERLQNRAYPNSTSITRVRDLADPRWRRVTAPTWRTSDGQLVDGRWRRAPRPSAIERERDAWKALAEALAEVAMARRMGQVTDAALERLHEARAQLRALGIEPPGEPEIE